MLIAYVTINSL